ncbi:hypothetical protein K1719_043079 [Acacia pycnantha]|nr:hypothetical protein K1719_043079 [Acacia pycnantha]
MGGLLTLQTLYLAENKLEGPIPESLSGMISMESLDLSHNYLSGVIPKSLELLLYLKYINLSYNLLHGEIPNGGPFQNFSAQSFMMNKDLCGKSQLQVQPCRKGNRHISNKVMLTIKCLLPTIIAMLIVLAIVVLKNKRDDDKNPTKRDLITLDTPTRISYYELLRGTNGFDECNLIGSGSFGSVYKALLPNEKIVRPNGALEYLHHGSSTVVVHCDVKPSNVLLDEDMVAHLGDFGIAKLFGEKQLEIYTKTLATIGYMAPEFGSKGVVSQRRCV